MAKTYGVGLVGYGGIGRMHALCFQMLPVAYPDLAASARIVAVATRSAASAERARRELGDMFVTTDYRELIARPDVTLVDCCTPTDDHVGVAEAALDAGKPLFCEKPLSASAGDSARIVKQAQAAGVPGGMNFHFRQIPALQEAQRLITNGLFGELTSFHMRYYRASNLKADRPLTWRFAGPGSGVLVDLGSHLIDLTLHLLGSVSTVAARTRTVIPERPGPDGQPQQVPSDDVAWLELGLANGARGTLEASKVVPGAGDDLRVEAYGTRGTLIFDSRDPNHLYVADERGGRQIATWSRTTPAASLPGGEMSSGWIQWHAASIAAFLDALGRGTTPQPGLYEGLQVDRVIDAAFASARQDGGRVEVSG
ncbi:MAG TPA: Gfo/Idh/MocA family oxidoreductase [Roseiflexaceae bacterium]|nr:Gfo/Idh/MocA family oxidoreductase [Roseiflexaceae bacterium]